MNSKIKSKMKRRKTLALLIEKHLKQAVQTQMKKEVKKRETAELSENGISTAQMISNFRKK